MSASSDRLQAILRGPALAAPTSSNDVNQQGNSRMLLIIVSIWLVVAGLAIIFRLYTQLSLHNRIEFTDCKF